MEKLMLGFGVVMSLSSFLEAWDFECKGDGINFTYSRDARPLLAIGKRNYDIKTFEKKSLDNGITLSGEIDDLICQRYSVFLQCIESSFETYINIESPTEPTKKYKMACQFTRWVQ